MTGFTSRCDIYERKPRDDGYGGVTDGEPVLVRASVPCRRSKVSKKDKTDKLQGFGGRDIWRFSTAYFPGLAFRDEGDVEVLYSVFWPEDGKWYDCIDWNRHGNKRHSWDHLEFIAEMR